MTALKLNRVWTKQIFFTLTEHGAIRVLDAVTTLVLIRVLSAPDFGLFSVYQSWVAMALLFFPAIEVALFREYATLKKEKRLSDELAVYRLFNYAKLIALIAMVLALSTAAQPAPWPVRAALLAFAFALPFSQSFYSFMREPLRFEMRQHTVALVSLVQRALLVGALVAMTKLAPGNVTALVGAALGAYAIAGLAWSASTRDFFENAPFFPSDAYQRTKDAFFRIVVWVHLAGVITQSVQTFDVFALNVFKADLSEIGRYGIALKAANFFQIIPIALTSSFGVYLARNSLDGRKDERRIMTKYLLLFTLLCVGLFGLGLVVGKPLLAFLAKGKLDAASLERTRQYFTYQLAGVLILCSSYPLTTFLSLRGSLSRLFFEAGLPWLVCSVAIYLWAAHDSVLSAARANMLVCGASVLIHGFYFLRHHRR